MIIEITGKTTIRDIQEQFQKTYPYLLIRFSDKHHEFGAPTNKGYWYAPSCRLHDIMSKPRAHYIDIHSWNKTGEVEEQFEKKFNLHPQIFRKEDDQWVQTAGTDILSLYEQNEIGKKSAEDAPGNLWIEREKFL